MTKPRHSDLCQCGCVFAKHAQIAPYSCRGCNACVVFGFSRRRPPKTNPEKVRDYQAEAKSLRQGLKVARQCAKREIKMWTDDVIRIGSERDVLRAALKRIDNGGCIEGRARKACLKVHPEHGLCSSCEAFFALKVGSCG